MSLLFATSSISLNEILKPFFGIKRIDCYNYKWHLCAKTMLTAAHLSCESHQPQINQFARNNSHLAAYLTGFRNQTHHSHEQLFMPVGMIIFRLLSLENLFYSVQ
uniref:Uncharacterized protein n=1 Tax=Micrurus paraensis TaxID=1970185 RepID=A0A2D4JX37_9SAUR